MDYQQAPCSMYSRTEVISGFCMILAVLIFFVIVAPQPATFLHLENYGLLTWDGGGPTMTSLLESTDDDEDESFYYDQPYKNTIMMRRRIKEPSDEPLKYLRNYEKGFSKSRFKNSECRCRSRTSSRVDKPSMYKKHHETSRSSTIRLKQLRISDEPPVDAEPMELYFSIPE